MPEGVQEELVRDVPPMQVPPSDTTGPSSMPAIEKKVNPAPDGAPGGAVLVKEVLDQKDTPASASPPSWEDMMEMLRWVPCFIDAEPLSTKMLDFFHLTKRISINPGSEPPVFVSVRLSFGTLEFIISRIQQL